MILEAWKFNICVRLVVPAKLIDNPFAETVGGRVMRAFSILISNWTGRSTSVTVSESDAEIDVPAAARVATQSNKVKSAIIFFMLPVAWNTAVGLTVH